MSLASTGQPVRRRLEQRDRQPLEQRGLHEQPGAGEQGGEVVAVLVADEHHPRVLGRQLRAAGPCTRRCGCCRPTSTSFWSVVDLAERAEQQRRVLLRDHPADEQHVAARLEAEPLEPAEVDLAPASGTPLAMYVV